MSAAFRVLAKELAANLNHELSRQETAPAVRADSAELLDLLVSALADRVALELRGRQNEDGPGGPEALLNLAWSMRDDQQSSREGETDEQADDPAPTDRGGDVQAKSPKYANIESLLRYDEARDVGPGVKLVIMNFND